MSFYIRLLAKQRGVDNSFLSMRKSLLTIALLFFANASRAEQLLPTAAGTTWDYDSTETMTGSAPANSKVTVTAGRQMLYGIELVKLETATNGSSPSKFELINVDDESITRLARSGKDGQPIKLNPPETIIVAPLKPGATWDSEDEVEGVKVRQHFTVLDEENVVVPAGKFKAFHVKGKGSSLISVTLDRWFVPGVGVVKEDTLLRGPALRQQRTFELVKLTTSAETKPPAEQSNASAKPSEPTTLATTPEPSDTASVTPSKKLTVEVSADPAGGLTTEFKSSVPRIYVRWSGHDLPEGARIKVVWVAEDVGDLVDRNFVVDETETVAATPNASARFTLARPPDGWAEGKYRVEFYIDNVLTETVNVSIK